MLKKVVVSVAQIAAGIVAADVATKVLDKAVVGVKKFVEAKKEESQN